MAQAVCRFLDSDGDRQAISDLDELHEAIDRVEAYQDFQPDRFDRRTLNRQLRLLAQDRGCGDDLQDSSGDPRRRRPPRHARDRMPAADRFEAGDAWPDLGRGQNDPERPSADPCRRSGGELSIAKAALS
jgi:hypothetical protein